MYKSHVSQWTESWQMLVEPTLPVLLTHFIDDRTEAQRNKAVKISKKVLEKRIVKCSELGPSPGNTALQGTQGVSPRGPLFR